MESLVNESMLFPFFKDKKVFITGHTGFKGSWLLAVIQKFGGVVRGYSLAARPNGLFSYLPVGDLCENIIDDVRNRERLRKEISEFQPDIVFHLAAQALVRESYIKPVETFEVNIMGTAHLLEAVLELDKKCAVVVVTTDKVYFNREENVLYNEDEKLGGYDPYSASKACAELVSAAFRDSFFNSNQAAEQRRSIATARAGNVIGGGDWNKDRIIPDAVNALRMHKAISVRNPLSVRPWQHVLEAISGYLLLAIRLYEEPEKFSDAYNFGPLPDDHFSVQQLIELFIACWGEGSWVNVSDPGNPHEAGLLKLDISKAGRELGWTPKLSAKDAIRWTAEWYKEPEEKIAACTFRQIREYFSA